MVCRELMEALLPSPQLTYVDASSAVKNSHMFRCKRDMHLDGIAPGAPGTTALALIVLPRGMPGFRVTWIVLD
jgi:hypothetical protein